MKTKFGNVKINGVGYYMVTSTKEGNHKKLLHRLIWEDFWGCEIPKGYVIHHKDGNKLNNCILNLQLMRDKDHRSLHSTGREVSNEQTERMSNLNKGKFGKEHPHFVHHARIRKEGDIYRIHYNGMRLKASKYLHKLYKWWGKNYPDKFIYLEIRR